MSKKIMKVQLGEEDIESKASEISKIVETNPPRSGTEILEKQIKEPEPVTANLTGTLLSAEEVTKIAIDFLKNLGNKSVMAKRVMKEGERNYTVEIDLKGKLASVLIDRNTKEIVEYEIKDIKKEISRGGGIEERGGSSFSPKIIITVLAMQIILMVVFNFLKIYVNIPFLTGPPPV